MSYGPDIAASYRRGAYYVDRLLKGAQAAELPIEAPSKVELAVNLKAAAALGLALPPRPSQAGRPPYQVGTSFARSRRAKEQLWHISLRV